MNSAVYCALKHYMKPTKLPVEGFASSSVVTDHALYDMKHIEGTVKPITRATIVHCWIRLCLSISSTYYLCFFTKFEEFSKEESKTNFSNPTRYDAAQPVV